MKICEIQIATSTEGQTDLFQTQGTFSCDDGYRILYTQEGDGVLLSFDCSSFRVKRSGETELSCIFRNNKCTVMRLKSLGCVGEIPVRTSAYSVNPTENGCEVTLKYDLIFSEHIQTFHLELKIETSEEK